MKSRRWHLWNLGRKWKFALFRAFPESTWEGRKCRIEKRFVIIQQFRTRTKAAVCKLEWLSEHYLKKKHWNKYELSPGAADKWIDISRDKVRGDSVEPPSLKRLFHTWPPFTHYHFSLQLYLQITSTLWKWIPPAAKKWISGNSSFLFFIGSEIT